MPHNPNIKLTLANALKMYEREFGTKTYERFVVQTTSGIHVFNSMETAEEFYKNCLESGVHQVEPLSENEYLRRYFSDDGSNYTIIQH